MTYEDACYQRHLILAGFTESYDHWLDGLLEKQNMLSDIVLSLVECGSNFKDIVACLHDFFSEKEFDQHQVCTRLRLYLKDAYCQNRLSLCDCLSAMQSFAENSGRPHDPPWSDMYFFDDYYQLASKGLLISTDEFNTVFLRYLTDGVPPHFQYQDYQNHRPKTPKPSFFQKIKLKLTRRS